MLGPIQIFPQTEIHFASVVSEILRYKQKKLSSLYYRIGFTSNQPLHMTYTHCNSRELKG